MDSPPPQPPLPTGPHVIIAGYGIPGRFVGELLDFHSIPYCVIETNEQTIDRCRSAPFIMGDARREEVLRQAGIEQATMLAVTIPAEDVVHEVIQTARRLRPDLRIIARANYTSAGLKAQQYGADAVIIAEQVVAREFFRLIEAGLSGQNVPV